MVFFVRTGGEDPRLNRTLRRTAMAGARCRWRACQNTNGAIRNPALAGGGSLAHNTPVTLLAIDARCLTANPSGMSRYAANLLPALLREARPDVRFCIVRHTSKRTPLDYPPDAQVDEVFVSSKIGFPAHYFLAGKELKAALSAHGQPALIHSLFHILPRGVQSLAPSVVSLLDLIWLDHAHTSQANWFEAVFTKHFGKLAIGNTLRRAPPHVLSISEASRVAAVRHFGPLPASVVSLGVEDAFFEPVTPSPSAQSSSIAVAALCAHGEQRQTL